MDVEVGGWGFPSSGWGWMSRQRILKYYFNIFNMYSGIISFFIFSPIEQKYFYSSSNSIH